MTFRKLKIQETEETTNKKTSKELEIGGANWHQWVHRNARFANYDN